MDRTFNASLSSSWSSSEKAALLTKEILYWTALFGNTLVILTILFQRSLKTNYYLLVLHLAFCDETLSLTNIVMQYMLPLSRVTDHRKILGVGLNVFMGIAHFTEPQIIILIAVLRYKAVAHPFSTGLTRKKLHCIIALMYTLAMFLSISYLMFFLWHHHNCGASLFLT